MNFYDPGNRQFTRRFLEESEMVFSAMDCLLNGEKGVYCSSELTTGQRLYATLHHHGLSTAKQLKDRFGEAWFEENVFQKNVVAACEFARDVKAHLDPHAIIITPAPFVALGWNQTEYLSFWETLIRTRVEAVCFNENWQYSNGCTFEFAVALDRGLPTFDLRAQVIDKEQAIRLIDRAAAKLDSESFDTLKLRQNLAYIRKAGSEVSFAQEQVSHATESGLISGT